MVEQLICNQQVAGSIPTASSVDRDKRFTCPDEIAWVGRQRTEPGDRSSEGFPSGQREQTENLSPLASKVRILLPPPRAFTNPSQFIACYPDSHFKGDQ